MKIKTAFLFLVLLCFVCINIFAQEFGTPKSNPSVVTYTDLPTLEQRLAWNKIHDEWLQNDFHVCLKENNLILSCATCSAIFLTVDFSIDSSGVVTGYQVVREKMCGSVFTESLKNCFLEYFLNVKFPEGLRNMIFEITIGNGLKC